MAAAGLTKPTKAEERQVRHWCMCVCVCVLYRTCFHPILPSTDLRHVLQSHPLHAGLRHGSDGETGENQHALLQQLQTEDRYNTDFIHYIYIYRYIHRYIHWFIYIVFLHRFIYIGIYIGLYFGLYISVYTSFFINRYISVYTSVYISVYIYRYIHRFS